MAALTISENNGLAVYTVGSTPSTGPFSVDFPYFSASEIVVTKTVSGVDTVLVNGTDYTLTGTAADDGYSAGSITLASSVSSCTLTIERDLSTVKATNFALSGPLQIKTLNTYFSRLFSWQQDLDRRQALSLSIPSYEKSLGLTLEASPVATRKGKILAWNATDGSLTHSSVSLATLENLLAVSGALDSLASLEFSELDDVPVNGIYGLLGGGVGFNVALDGTAPASANSGVYIVSNVDDVAGAGPFPGVRLGVGTQDSHGEFGPGGVAEFEGDWNGGTTVIIRNRGTGGVDTSLSVGLNFANDMDDMDFQMYLTGGDNTGSGTARSMYSVINTGDWHLQANYTSPRYLLSVLNTGRIGINKAAPTEMLDIVGLSNSAVSRVKVRRLDGTYGASLQIVGSSGDARVSADEGAILYLYAAGADLAQVDTNGFHVASGKDLYLGRAYVGGAPAATGYVTVKDSSGTTYKLLAAT